MAVTNLEAIHRHRSGDIVFTMKGKFPNGLDAAMRAKKIGPTELAREIGTSKQNVSRWQSGSRELTKKWALQMTGVLEATVDELMLTVEEREATKNTLQKTPKNPRSPWSRAG